MYILPLAFIQNLRTPEIILIFLVILLLFGAKRLPELFRSFGKSIKEFKKATTDIEDDIRTAMDTEETPPAPAHLQREKVQPEGTSVPDADALEHHETAKSAKTP